jgi:aminopeptidase N
VAPEPGIALALAVERAATIGNLRYDVAFSIPVDPAAPIEARAHLRFSLENADRPLVLDFEPGQAHLTSVTAGKRAVTPLVANGHIVIPAKELEAGENDVTITFRAGDASLNRTADFLYTLFVPARAHLAFPCFDQPDLKARFSLELTVPDGWQALANGAELSREPLEGRVRLRYRETEPIPTYLFAFAAGRFQVESGERRGRTYRLLHRETDAGKVARNREAVIDLHDAALAWMEEYTGIPYPFGKFDALLVPSFQFSGMEHPGAVYYNAASLFLDESATENQRLNRASVIAHETAHMWFGDLVTMRWFDDVWMKEVFANFMAAKIVNPAFPGVNHDLRFLVAHYPAAYAVDRTKGTHPVRQPLENLNEAGSLYGAIIYQKAPIVMRQLERLIGEGTFRDGLRDYLTTFTFGNATWRDLITLLDARTDRNLAEWSRTWIEEAGRPTITTELPRAGVATPSIVFVQADPQADRGLRWTEELDVIVGTTAGVRSRPLTLEKQRTELPLAEPPERVQFVLPAGGGLGYGLFAIDDASLAFLLTHHTELADPVTRGAVWITLWDALLERRVAPASFLDAALAALDREDTEQNVQLVTGYVTETFWRFLPPDAREAIAPRLERTLGAGLARATSTGMKSTFFSAFRSSVTTPAGLAYLDRVWRRQERVAGLPFAETDEALMALELAVRGVPASATILDEQRRRFENPDRKARFEFVMPALSADASTRDAFFKSLSDVARRRREPWVIEGLEFLNHPLRRPSSEQYIRPSLDLLAEIRRTGDIFFPRNWMDAVLGGHNSSAAAETVRRFLAEHADYPPRLRRIVLQSADDLFRAADR